MTSLADEYLRRAQEAHVMETESQDPFMRRTYRKIARHWLDLAGRVRREEAAAIAHRQRQLGHSSTESRQHDDDLFRRQKCRAGHDEPAALKLAAFAASPCPGHWAEREWRRTNTRISEDRLLCSRAVSI